jgi:hypothetical protein
MHPETAVAIAAQHRADMRHQVARCRRPAAHKLPHWHVSWSRTRLSPAIESSAGRRPGSSLIIIISASRTA